VPSAAGVIDFALHPPIGFLTPRLDTAGPYAGGQHLLTTWNDSGTVRNVSDSFGVMVQQTGSIPTKLGFQLGFDNGLQEGYEYEFRTIQLVVQHQMLGGFWAVTQRIESHTMGDFYLWAEAFPGRLGLYILPVLSFNLYFLRAL